VDGCTGIYGTGPADKVNSPPHYKHFSLEVIDIIKATFDERDRLDGLVVGTRFKAYCEGNEIKYRFRAGFKLDKDEDISKAMWYYDKRDKS
jgi:hypothetical protein